MTAVDDVDQLNEQYHLASGEFLKGKSEPVKKLWSHREDVSLANPYAPSPPPGVKATSRWYD